MENNDIWHQESIEYSLLCAQGVEDEMFQTAYKTNAFTKELVTNYTYILSSFIPKIKKTPPWILWLFYTRKEATEDLS